MNPNLETQQEEVENVRKAKRDHLGRDPNAYRILNTVNNLRK